MDAISVLKRTIGILFAALLVSSSGMAQISVSSTSVAFNSSMQSQSVNVTSNSVTAFTFTIAETDPSVMNVPWLRAYVGGNCSGANCATGNGSSGSGSIPSTLTVVLNNDLATQGAGPFHGTVTLTPMGSTTVAATINVTFTPGLGGTSSTPVTPKTLPVIVASGGMATNNLTLQNNTGTPITITITTTTTNGTNWLFVTSPTSPANVGTGGSIVITVLTDATGLANNNTYNGSVQIAVSGGNPTVSIPVTFNVGTSSGIGLSTVSVAFAYPNGNSQQAVTVSGVTSYSATASTTDGNPWLILSAGSQTGLQVTNVPVATPLNLLLGSAVTALATGNYTGTVVVQDVNSSSTATISVTLAVNGSATSIVVSPPPLSGSTPQINFYAETTGSASVPNQSLWISAPAGTFTAAVTSNNTPWLFLGASAGQIPGSLQVYALNLSGLAPNTYNGQITITAGSLTQIVNVVLTVTSNPVAYAAFTTVTGTNGTVLFTSGGTSQQVSVFASDGPTDTLTVSGVQAPTWLTVTQSGNQLTIAPNVSSQSAVLDSGYVTLIATNAANTIANNPVSIPVVLATGANGGALTITESQPLTFTSSSSGVTPNNVTVSVSAATNTPFSVSVPTSSPWINIQQGSFTTPQNFTVTINPGTLAPSSTPYTGEIDFTSNGVTQKLPVSLTVTGGSNAGNVSVDKSMLSFTAVAGGQAQSSTINVTSNGASVPFTVAVSVQGAGTWLSSDTSSASTPKTVTITADPTTLTAGIYQGSVTITPSSGSNPVTVAVMFTVQAPPMVSAGASSLSFTYFSGGSAPPAQTVLVSGSTGGFTATAASDTGNWLMVTPASGAVGTNISISVNPTGIAIGSHTGTVTIAGTNGLTGQAVINVLLTITAPLPSVTSVGNGASYAQGTAAPGEVITLFGSNLGPATPVTAQIVNGYLATQLGGVQVLVSGVPAPMIYASATQVSAVVPYEVARFSVAAVGIKYLGQTSNIVTLPVVPTAPGIFTQNQSGTGAVGFNGDFSVNGPSNPAPKGSTMVLFLTGEGQTNPAGITGTINSTPNMNPMPVAPITVTIDGQPTTYSYAGGIEGVVEGIMQLNVVVPAAARSGTVPIVVTIGANSTQTGATVSVK